VKNTPRYHKFLSALAVGFFCGARVEERAKMTYRDIFVGGRNEIFIPANNAKNGEARYIYPEKNFRECLDYRVLPCILLNTCSQLFPANPYKGNRYYPA